MTLNEAIEIYVTLKRSLGAVFASDNCILRSFARVLGNVPVETISRQACDAFCRGTTAPTRWSERKHQSLRGFFNYLVSRSHLAMSPLPEPGPQVHRSFQAYIYSRDELRRLLDATAVLQNGHSALQPLTLRTLLLVLYGAGLRPSEGLRLRCCDVDLSNHVLAIWNTKFFKSRLVPIGTDLSKALDTYQKARQCLPMPAGNRSAFFAFRAGKPISLGRLEAIFARLRQHAGIQRPPDDGWQPRLHDLRHTFAVHRLIAWYHEGADLHGCLPLLATYLGHINVSGTQAYLTLTPELLAEASKRFERYAAVAKEDYHG